MTSLDSSYVIIFIMLIVVMMVTRQSMLLVARHRQNRRGKIILTKELAQRLMGKSFVFTYAMSAGSIKGEVVSTNENWIEVRTKKNTCFLNVDYVIQVSEVNS